MGEKTSFSIRPQLFSRKNGANWINRLIVPVFGDLVLSFVIGFYILVWTKPSTNPPGGNRAAPINVGSTTQTKRGTTLNFFSRITGGFYHTCALLKDGTAKCWGRNDYGQLGDGSTGYSTTPVSVVGF